MKIDLTKDQYQILLRIMYCGEWMLNSYKTKNDKLYRETDQFEQYIYSFAKGQGLDNWIEFDAELGRYFPTSEMEIALDKFIDKYNQKQKEL